MKRGKGKLAGPDDVAQKKITSWFKRTANPVTEDRSLSEAARKRRKTSSLLKPQNSQEPVPVVDLLDSEGDDDFYCADSVTVVEISTAGPSRKADEGQRLTASKIPVYIAEFDKVGVKTEDDNSKANAGEDEGKTQLVQTTSAAVNIRDEDERDENSVFESSLEKTQTMVVDDSDTDYEEEGEEGKIFVRNFSSILESSQSSQEGSQTTQSDSQSSVKIEYISLSERKTISPSPVKKSTPSKSKTPVKAPKSKLAYFSPIRQLNKSRASSKTPSKNSPNTPGKSGPSPLKSPARNLGFDSSLKALWANAKPKPEPYYLKNFLVILDSVEGDEHNAHLLNEEDKEYIRKFRELSHKSKCLFVRLAGRSWRWLKVSSVRYNEIGDDPTNDFEELHRQGFVVSVKDEKLQLEELLDLISCDKLPEICKQMNIKTAGNSKTKEKCIDAILKTAKKQSTLKGSMEDILYKKAMAEVGQAYKLSAAPRALFSRIFILYRPPQYWEQESDQDKLQLLDILLNNRGKVEYPTFKVKKTQHIYEDRDSLLAFQDAWKLLYQMEGLTESKQWDAVGEVAEEALSIFILLLENEKLVQSDKKLPLFLRAYVAGTILARICWIGADGFQKQKNYQRANDFLHFLLKQNVYLVHYYGRWYERLVVNSTHLKKPPGAIRDLIELALADSSVRDNHKHDLHVRLTKMKLRESKQKIAKKKKGKRKRKKRTEDSDDSSSSDDEECEDLDDLADGSDVIRSYHLKHKVPERTIEGEKMLSFDREYGKSVFLGAHGDGASRALSSVEQFALNFYKTEGYTDGVHAEGSVPTTIYGLLFWSVIYNDEIPDAFHSPYQAFPLDMFFDDFFTRRQTLIEEMFKKLESEWTMDDVLGVMQTSWSDNANKLSIVNWGIFETFSQLETLVRSMGLPLITGICRRLATNYRYYRSGFPDLIVWNESKCRIAEVKGPGDKLSAKQKLWIDHLLDLNADVEVCLVKSVSSKRLRRS